MSNDLLRVLWDDQNKSAARIQRQLKTFESKAERAETAGGIVSFLYADRPLAATGGVSDNINYVDFIFVSDGRKSGEGVGAGTGVPCWYDATIDDYRTFYDNSIVVN